MARARKPPRIGDDLRLVALVVLAGVCVVSVVTAVAVLVAMKRLDKDVVNTLVTGTTGIGGMALGRLSGASGDSSPARLAAAPQGLMSLSRPAAAETSSANPAHNDEPIFVDEPYPVGNPQVASLTVEPDFDSIDADHDARDLT